MKLNYAIKLSDRRKDFNYLVSDWVLDRLNYRKHYYNNQKLYSLKTDPRLTHSAISFSLYENFIDYSLNWPFGLLLKEY